MTEEINLRKTLRRNLRKAYQGWYLWHCLVKKYRLQNTAVVLMPSENRDYNYYALLYLDQMLEKKGFKSAILLTHDDAVVKSASLFSAKIEAVQPFSREQAEKLMQFYSMFEFDVRFLVASLEEPAGRNSTGLIGKKGTTAEEIFAIGVYGLLPLKKEKPPQYSGNNPAILSFLKINQGGQL
ncbi:hypothetical protein [Caproicibacter sp.]|uniref:hypothetical protein n=1 Tax=Caproicibacter sp. TaxID=2814884 RepID=UPI0039893701